MSTKPTIAFFGATGGCALNTLVLSLKAGYTCVAFARTPAKLTDLLTKAPHSVSQKTIDLYLKIVSGNIMDTASIKPVFACNPALIISGIGAAPKFNKNPLNLLEMDQPSICTDAANNIVATLKELSAEGALQVKPFFVVLSSTGMHSSPLRDLPYLMFPLYKVLIAKPHIDKGNMEAATVTAAKENPSVLSGYAIVRPSLLMDGPSKGINAVKMGWDRHVLSPSPGAPGPAIGYTIRRADVGLWMYENLVNGNFNEWNDRCVSITY